MLAVITYRRSQGNLRQTRKAERRGAFMVNFNGLYLVAFLLDQLGIVEAF
jgi:hypothetical protein